MSARQVYLFDPYRLRPATENDLQLAVEWTEADPYHAGKTAAEFWIEQRPQRDSYMLEDQEGPLFFFKLHHLSMLAVELHIQFPPATSENHQRYRVQRGLIDGFSWLETALKTGPRVQTVHFDTMHPPLKKFAIQRLGFDTSQGVRLSKSIGV